MGREQDVDDFVAAKASDFNKSQQLSMSGVQQIQYQSVKNRRFLQTSIRVGIWFGTKGVGGSNPLSPTNSFNGLHAISGMPPSAIWQRPCSHSSVSVSLPFELAQRFFVSFLFEVSLHSRTPPPAQAAREEEQRRANSVMGKLTRLLG
jgi:hypothetical protein